MGLAVPGAAGYSYGKLALPLRANLDPLHVTRLDMIFRQLFDSTSSTYSYVLASRHGGEALIIDPVLERVDRYIQLLKELDLRLVKAIDTHLHADHITGLDALRERTRCITVMGEQTKADVVSIRVADGDRVGIEGLSLEALYTPGHTDDSYSYILPDRVFTGDTLLIRGTGRTDFQNGDPRAQYASLFGRLLKLPEETLVYPAHDYKGDTVSTIGEEKAFNPRLQVKSIDEYVELMSHLNLPNPKMMDVAVPANMRIGLARDIAIGQGWTLTAEEAKQVLGKPEIALIDLREDQERRKDGIIPGSLHVPYLDVEEGLKTEGLLQNLAKGGGKRLIFFCTFGQRSAMAVQAAQAAGLTTSRHIQGGLQAWQQAHGPLTR
jgi:sulfur dioxygenase